MAEYVHCPQCGTRQRIASQRMGQELLCGKCRQPFQAHAACAASRPLPAAPTAHRIVVPASAQRSASIGSRRWLVGSVLILVVLVTLGVVLALQWQDWVPALAKAPASKSIKPMVAMAPASADKAVISTKTVQGETPGTFEFFLGARIKDVAVGGGGRYLVVHLSKLRQLLVFDTRARMLHTTIPVDDKNLRIAAGQRKLLVALNNQRLLERYDLATGKRESSVPYPVAGPILSLTLGAASENPALLYGADGPDQTSRTHVRFLDVSSLQLLKIAVKPEEPGSEPVRQAGAVMHFRAAAEGSVFGAWCTSSNPQGIETYVYDGSEVQYYREDVDGGAVLPAADGRMLFTELGLIPTGARSKKGRIKMGPRFPSVQGNYYLKLLPAVEGLNPPAEICLGGSMMPLQPILLTGAEINNEDAIDNDLTNDKRIHLLPRDNLLITIPPARDRFVLHSFNAKQMLKLAANYLFVASQPPTVAQPGEKLVYQLEIESKQGGVLCQLESGPAGATVSASGEFVWNVPVNVAVESKVAITVSDLSGRKVTHAFRLSKAPTQWTFGD